MFFLICILCFFDQFIVNHDIVKFEAPAFAQTESLSSAELASTQNWEAKGKGKHHAVEQESPFAQTARWPTPDSATASSPFQQSLIAPASALTDADDADLLVAVREMYPDISKAPPRIQTAVAKAEKTTAKQLTSGLNKSSKSVGNAAKELQSLREARARHRERWLQHLKDAVNTWEHQLKLYTEQQTNYSKLIKKAQQELNAARQTLEMLTKKQPTVLATTNRIETQPTWTPKPMPIRRHNSW
eukprot:s1600_g20.t1